MNPGQSGIIWLSQDNNGSRAPSWGSYWKFPSNTAPTLSTTASAVDAIVYVVRNSTSITAQAILNDTTVASISMSNIGSGYTYATVTISGGGASVDATASANIANGVIQNVYITYPGSGYLSTPTISIADANSTPGTGASATVVSEYSPKGGNAYAKYFTKKVILTPGNDSGDLRVFYTAYRPVGTNIYVYYKILSSQDTQPFDNNNWQLMTTMKNQNTFSTNRNDLYEFETAPGINNQANNTIGYTNVNGQTFNNFIQFAIKIVLATNDNTNPPFLVDLRALALPAGTGI